MNGTELAPVTVYQFNNTTATSVYWHNEPLIVTLLLVIAFFQAFLFLSTVGSWILSIRK